MQLPSHIQNLPPYIPIEPFEVLSERVGRSPEQIIKLDANENPYGMSPRARAALANLPYGHIYPDPESRALRAALSAFTNTPAENLLTGAGADLQNPASLSQLIKVRSDVLIPKRGFTEDGFAVLKGLKRSP